MSQVKKGLDHPLREITQTLEAWQDFAIDGIHLHVRNGILNRPPQKPGDLN